MLTESDQKYLSILNGKWFIFFQIALASTVAISIAIAYIKFNQAISFAAKGGLGEDQLIDLWLSGIQLSKSYSGYEHYALNRLSSALLSMMCIPVYCLFGLILHKTRVRNRRILEALGISEAAK